MGVWDIFLDVGFGALFGLVRMVTLAWRWNSDKILRVMGSKKSDLYSMYSICRIVLEPI